MKTFKDEKGRDWSVHITVDSIKRVRSKLDVDLMQLVEPEFASKLLGDVINLVNIIYIVCKPEADERSISDEDFGRALAGESLDQAIDAFLNSLTEFFPLAKRRFLMKALEKSREVEARTLETITKLLDDPRLEAKIRAELENVGNSFGKSLDKSE